MKSREVPKSSQRPTPTLTKYVKNCSYCNEEFFTKVSHSKFCKNPHYANCVVCGERFKIRDIYRISKTCSQSCASVLTHNERSRKVRRQNSIRKYGVEHPTQAAEIKEKIRDSLDNSEKDMRIGSERWNKMLMDKYGVSNVSEAKDIQRAKEAKMLCIYGYHNPSFSHIKNYNDYIRFDEFVADTDMSLLDLQEYFNITLSSLKGKILKLNLGDKFSIHNNYSYPERLFLCELSRLANKSYPAIQDDLVDFMYSSRDLLKNGQEVDFFFQRSKVGVEISPTYTHNAKFSWGKKGPGLPAYYHQTKFSIAKEEGINLLTVFDWVPTINWVSYLLTLLKAQDTSPQKLTAEELSCRVLTYTDKDVEDFIERNRLTDIRYSEKLFILESQEGILSILAYDKSKNILHSHCFDVNYCREEVIKIHIHKVLDLIHADLIELSLDNSVGPVNLENLNSQRDNIGLTFTEVRFHGPELKLYDCKKLCLVEVGNEDHVLPVYDCGSTILEIRRERYEAN